MGCGSSSEFPDDEPRAVVVFGATGLLGGAVARALLEDPLRFRIMGCGSSSEFPDDEPRTVVVFGATGLLGGAVARALLEDPLRFRVRAVTRRPSSEKARKLAEDGAVIVTANQNDIASLEKALDGADAMFLTTHYWEDKNKEKEIVRGLNAIDAAVQKGLTHVVFNGSENVKRTIGKDCGHLDSKAAIEEYLREVGSENVKRTIGNLDSKAAIEEYLREVGINYTIVRLPFWYENFTTIFTPHKVKHGLFAVAVPMEDRPLDMMSVSDVGDCLVPIFNRPRYYSQKTISLGADRLTTEEIARAFNKRLYNKKFIYPKIRIKDYERFEFPGSQELTAMFEFYQKSDVIRDVKATKRLNPKLRTLDKWLHQESELVEAAIKENEGIIDNPPKLDKEDNNTKKVIKR